MIRTVLRMRVREGCESSFENTWAEAAPRIGEYPGLLGQSLLREKDESRTYVIMADWDSQDHLSAFEDGPVRRELSAALTPLREAAQKTVLSNVDVDQHGRSARS